MRFQRAYVIPFSDTKLKRLAYERKVKRERQKYPLLDMVGALQFDDVDTRMAKAAVEWDEYDVKYRENRLKAWLKARKQLREHPKAKEIYAFWQRSTWTPLPEYLLDLIRGFEGYQKDRQDYEAKQALLNAAH